MHHAGDVRNQGGLYRTEHMLAWVMAAVSIVLGIVGALEAFDIISIGDSNLTTAAAAEARNDANIFADGALFLLPALIAAFLALTLHRSEHHELGGDMGRASGNEPTIGDGLSAEKDLFKGEHAAAYFMTGLTIVLATIGVLTGFRVFDDEHTFYDGMTWLLLATGSSILANALHSVGHHLPSRAPRYVTTASVSGDLPGTTGAARPGMSPR